MAHRAPGLAARPSPPVVHPRAGLSVANTLLTATTDASQLGGLTSKAATSSCGRVLSAAAAGLAAAYGSSGRWRSKARRPARGGQQPMRAPLDKTDEWIANVDLDAWGKEVHELGKRLKKEQNEDDNKHLEKMIWWSRICAGVGFATMWWGPNPVSAVALALWTHSAWTMIGHHVCHGGYNRSDKTGKYSSRGFALGSIKQRVMDWFDWMLPEAWNQEHNALHHYRLGEDGDPDLLERNAESWKGVEKKTMPFLSMLLWKWAYYAPNTYKELKLADMRKKGIEIPEDFDCQAPLTLGDLFAGKGSTVVSTWEFFRRVVGPYFLIHFFVLPLPFLALNPAFYWNAVANLFLADVLSNIHGFIVIVTNHAGNDLYRFQVPCKPYSPTFYMRAVTSSANFDTGSNPVDFMHGWLNYQIEHHCWPDLSMLSYQKAQPELKAICEKHGVPYIQENVFIRLKKTMDIAMGKTKMRVYPVEYERPEDAHVWLDEQQRLKVATA